MSFLQRLGRSLLFAPCSMLFNDLVRQREYVGRKREADVFGRLQVDDELKLRRLLDNRLTDFFHGARLKNI
jgi:hypothetical protein